jgi:hypothetical protein
MKKTFSAILTFTVESETDEQINKFIAGLPSLVSDSFGIEASVSELEELEEIKSINVERIKPANMVEVATTTYNHWKDGIEKRLKGLARFRRTSLDSWEGVIGVLPNNVEEVMTILVLAEANCPEGCDITWKIL